MLGKLPDSKPFQGKESLYFLHAHHRLGCSTQRPKQQVTLGIDAIQKSNSPHRPKVRGIRHLRLLCIALYRLTFSDFTFIFPYSTELHPTELAH